ncbi:MULTISPECIES: hypothetical protein [Pseudomonas]|uniref:Minor tail protein n=1 Tax=Pseudomonas azadiae TaxID=2843612 RepID=A0ABS6P614_9PSED|nr:MULTISPECIES: hypothetical protein [Pseudomonas]MBV4455898.1 hypothetical protein [Pseudomonas azadiae]NMF40360.1 hypothetical protein [Pseudomonas sp. SWRI 103]
MKRRNRRLLKNAPSADPIPISLDPPLIDGLVDPIKYGGLIYRDKADQAFLDVLIPTTTWVPAPTNPLRPDVLDVYLDDPGNFEGGHFFSEPVFFPVGAIPATHPVRIPRRLLTEGHHTVSCKITSGGPGGNESGSTMADLNIDRSAPFESVSYVPRALTLPTGWPGRITETFLASFDAEGGVPFGIPDYVAEGADIGDLWYLFERGSNVPIAEGPVFPDEVVRYSRALAEEADGAKQLAYRLGDVAGNVSDLSFELSISVALEPPPTLAAAGVKDAVTPAGAGDRLLDYEEAGRSNGAFVIIPAYVADYSTDQILVGLTTTHGTRDIGPYPLGGSPFPYNFHIPYAVLKALYATSIGPINLRLIYSVIRHGVPHVVPTATNIDYDLSKGGPDYPEEPDPVNSNLPRPVLTGAGSGKVNELDEDDVGLDADVAVTLWSGAPLPSSRDFKIHLLYMGDLVDSKPVVAATALPGDIIAMKVAWLYIQRHANNLIPLYYEIEIVGTANRGRSLTQDINVNANVISFLKPSVVGALPEVPGTSPLPGEIRCGAVPAPQRVARVSVPPNTLLAPGMIIVVNWNARSNDDGTGPLPAASGTFPYGPISSTEALLGFTVPVGPFHTYVSPINAADNARGSVIISYTVPNIGTLPVTSAEALFLVRVVAAGPVYCDNVPWP